MTTLIWAIVVLGALAIIFGLILAVAAKVFEVEVDPRLPEIQACLAGANCGGCGYPGCGGCAEAILAGKAPVTACAPAGPENAAKIAAIMGMEAPSGDKMVAHVLCNGGCNAKDNFEYRGVKDCLAATKVCGGDAKACKYGCFGFGSCVAACKFDAIHVVDGVAVVDKEKCTNCGACRAACPHHLIVEVPIVISEGTLKLPVEIQLRTIAMDMWASLEHELRYKSQRDFSPSDAARLRLCSDAISEIDREMQDIYQGRGPEYHA